MANIDLHRDLTRSQEWLRDRIIALINIGYLAVIALAGWSLRDTEIGDISICLEDAGAKACQAPAALLILGNGLLFVWVREVLRIQKHLGDLVHATVRPRKLVFAQVLGIAAILELIFLLVAF